ncbi:MAG: CAP domain-containing protein [Burkholderiaceae bacterium]|nr:CAP domain-containing protein [Burkholderiaceae bacterium]
MRGIPSAVLLIAAIGLATPALAQSGPGAPDSRPLYEGPIAAHPMSPASPAVHRVASPETPAAPGSGHAAGEPELMLASIDARSLGRTGVAQSSDFGSVSRYALRVLEVVNEYRARNGLAALRIADDLGSIAQSHSGAMAERRRISHDGFRERFDRTRSRICVENVGVNFTHPEAQVEGWRASPGHDRNLLEPRVTRVGIANTRNFVTFFACS